ncbi:MAG: hypothetical protein Q9188_007576, partial [Gyalolechia gomerana]
MADYTRLASMIARYGEAAIFRRFDALNIKNLLYMQAELVHLEAELHQIEKEERSSTDPSKSLHPISVYDLRDSASRGLVTQWTKYQDIQRKIQTYNGALLQYHSLRKIAKPTANTVEFLREWLDRPEGGDFFLKGREATIWDAEDDFVSLESRQSDKDSLTALINEKVVPWYHRRWGHRTKLGSRTSGIRFW